MLKALTTPGRSERSVISISQSLNKELGASNMNILKTLVENRIQDPA